MNTPPTSQASPADHDPRLIEDEQHARAYLDRLNTGMAQSDDLAALLMYLRGELLRGACRVIEKALGGRRHG